MGFQSDLSSNETTKVLIKPPKKNFLLGLIVFLLCGSIHFKIITEVVLHTIVLDVQYIVGQIIIVFLMTFLPPGMLAVGGLGMMIGSVRSFTMIGENYIKFSNEGVPFLLKEIDELAIVLRNNEITLLSNSEVSYKKGSDVLIRVHIWDMSFNKLLEDVKADQINKVFKIINSNYNRQPFVYRTDDSYFIISNRSHTWIWKRGKAYFKKQKEIECSKCKTFFQIKFSGNCCPNCNETLK